MTKENSTVRYRLDDGAIETTWSLDQVCEIAQQRANDLGRVVRAVHVDALDRELGHHNANPEGL